MVVGKFVARVIQSLPTWEVTKYYGRVCWFQLQCLKYRIETSEAWFNFRSKYMPGSLKSDADYDDKCGEKKDERNRSKMKISEASDESSMADELLSKISKNTFIKEKLEQLQMIKKKVSRGGSSQGKSAKINGKSDEDTKNSDASKSEQKKS